MRAVLLALALAACAPIAAPSSEQVRWRNIQDHCEDVAAIAGDQAITAWMQANPMAVSATNTAALSRAKGRGYRVAYRECLMKLGYDPFAPSRGDGAEWVTPGYARALP
ncbi:MAG: hypothetical protein HY521_13120 [Proteobacteria bacterium]|nr:hypothetical protein [Pseudomonadota bacterium]